MKIGKLAGIEGCAPHLRDEPVEYSECQKAVPSHSADMDVRDCPVGVMRDCVDVFQRKKRSFERRHAIGSYCDSHKFQDSIFSDFVPCTPQCQEAVDCAAP